MAEAEPTSPWQPHLGARDRCVALDERRQWRRRSAGTSCATQSSVRAHDSDRDSSGRTAGHDARRAIGGRGHHLGRPPRSPHSPPWRRRRASHWPHGAAATFRPRSASNCSMDRTRARRRTFRPPGRMPVPAVGPGRCSRTWPGGSVRDARLECNRVAGRAAPSFVQLHLCDRLARGLRPSLSRSAAEV